MSYKVLFILNALVAVILGVAFLFMPARVLDFFGTEKYEATLLAARFLGAATFSFGLVVWFAKDADASIQKRLGWVLLVSMMLGLVVTVVGVSPASGVIRTNGWIPIVVYVFFALLYGFMLFLKPKMKE